MEKKEKKKLLLAITLSMLSLSSYANAQDVSSWADLSSTLKLGTNATLTQDIQASSQYIDMDGVNSEVSLDLNNYSITGAGLGTAAITPGFGKFSIVDGTIQNFVNDGSHASEWGIAAMLGGALQNNGSNSYCHNVAFNNNSAPFGGAIANLKAIVNNIPASQDNKITVTSTDSNYTGNTAQLGGAILNLATRTYGSEDEFAIEQGEFAKNAIVNIKAESKDVTFSGNSATTAGGAIFNMGTVNIEAAERKKVEFATASDDIYNNNELNLVSGDIIINSAITDKNVDLSAYGLGTFGGQGVTNIKNGANVVANAIDQKALNIENGGTLTTNVSGLDVTDTISNNGVLNLNGGKGEWNILDPLTNTANLNENISGNGSTNFASGNTQVTSNIETEININDGETNVLVSNNNQGKLTLGQSGKDINNNNGVLGIDKNVNIAGNLTTGSDSETYILYANSISSSITNNGQLGLFDGTLSKNVTGNGTVVIGGNLNNNAEINADYVQIAEGFEILGQNYTGHLTTDASNVTSANGIINNSLLTFTGGTNANVVSGSGSTIIAGEVTNNAQIAQAVDIQSGKLTSSANNLGGAISNAAKLELNGGTLTQNITGAGTTTIAGNVISNSAIANAITINAEKSLSINANNIQGSVANSGTLNIGDGTLAQNVTGEGVANINGSVVNTASIGQNVTIASSGNLTSNLANITGTVTNNGTFNLGDNLSKNISGNGTTILGNNIALAENRTVSGTLNMNDKTINMGNDPAQYTELNVGNLTGNGNLQIDVDLTNNDGKATSNDKINITSGTSNSGTLNLDVINVENELATSDSPYEDYIDYVTGTTDGITFNINGSADGQIVAVTTDHKYTFTKGSDGSLNVVAQDYTGGLSDYISGDVQANNFSINKDIVLNDNQDIGITAGKDTTKNVFVNNDSSLKGYDGETAHNNGITVADGYTLNLTGSENASMENFVTAIQNNKDGILNVTDMNFKNNTTDIANDGTLTLAGTNTFEKGISGEGVMNVVSGTTTNNGTISQNDVSINSGAALNTNASNLTVASKNVANNGTLNFTGGTNVNNITGTGSTTIANEVENSANITQNTLVNNGTLTNTGIITAAVTNSGTMTSSADNIVGTVANSGTYNVQGGTIANAVSGEGTLNLSGDVTNNAEIAQKTVTVDGTMTNNNAITAAVTNNGTLTSSADNIVGTVANSGIYNVQGGTIANAISGEGTLNLSGDVVSNADNTLTGNVNILEGAKLSLGANGDLFAEAAGVNAHNGSTISLLNGNSAETSMDNLVIAADSSVNLELDWGDTLNTKNANKVEGNIELSKIDLTSQEEDNYQISTTIGDKISLSDDVELIVGENGNNYLDYNSADGKLTAANVASVADAIAKDSANGVYQMTGDETLTGDLGTLGENANTLTINGGGNVLNGGNNKGVTVGEGQTLNLANMKEVGGFADETAVQNEGTVNLSQITLNDKITGSGTSNITGDTTINNAVEGNTLNLNSGIFTLGQMGDLSQAAALNANGGTLSLQNGAIQNTNLGNLTLNQDMNLMLDGNFAEETLDTISANQFTSNGNHINISNINILQPTTEKTFSISPIGEGMNEEVRAQLAGAVQYTGGEMVYSPIYKYSATYDPNTAMMNFVRGGGGSYGDYNPSVMASPVAAQLGGYLTQLNSYDEAFRNMDMYMLMTKKQREAMKLRNKYAAADGNLMFDPTGSHYDDKAVWFRPYATFENVPLKGGPKVSNVAYGSFFGADSELYDLGHGWDGMFSVYAGYNGSHQAYDGIGIYQNGGTLGAVGMAYKGNFFTGLTINAGANAGEANTFYGTDNFTMLMAGIASKTGYNVELADGKFIIQPNFLMSYSFVNTFDYTNAAGVHMDSDPLHAIQIEPGLKFIGNLKNGWQPYLGVSMVWNIMDQTQFRANNVSLPELSVKPFVRYGLGVRKTWGERCVGFLQAYFTNGGRNGVGLQAGFRFTLGKDPGSSIKTSGKVPELPKTHVTLNSIK